MYRKMLRGTLVPSALLALVLLTALPQPQASPAGEGWLSGWSYRKQITIDHMKVDANLDNFPVLVNLSDPDLSKAKDNGDDLLFTKSDGATKLDHEIENFDGENLIAWVRIPFLSASEDTLIYMYYGNPTAGNQENVTGVWSTDFLTVYHFSETTGDLLDSTSNDHDAILNGPTQGVAGEIGNAYDFVSGDYVEDVDAELYLDGLSAITFSAWVESDVTGVDKGVLIGTTPSGSDYPTVLRYDSSGWLGGGTNVIKCGVGIGGTEYNVETTSNVQTTSWQHIVVTWSSGNDIRVYLDGSEDPLSGKSYTTPPTGTTGTNTTLIIGKGAKDTGGSDGWDGKIEEVRISNVERSAGWISTEYNNQSSPSTFYSVGSEEVSIPSKPELQQPEYNLDTNDNTPAFQWISGQNADNHRLLVDNDANFGSPIENKLLGATTENYTLSDDNPLTDGKYYWKVVAINPQGENSSDVWSFVVDLVPPLAPSLNSPENNDKTDDNHITFSWMRVADNTEKTSNVSGIAHYELWVDEDPGFSSPSILENTPDNLVLSLTREVAGRLYWRVRAWDRAGNPGAFSEIRRLTVFSFSLSTGSTSLTVLRGNTGAAGLSIDLVFGDQENVDLSYTWEGMEPTGITPSFDPPSDTVPFSSTLTFQTSSDASTGEFTCRVTATSESGITRNVDISIQVAGMSFFVLASPTSISLIRSDDAASTISIKFMMGTKENVGLSGSWLGSAPTGASAILDPQNGCPSYDSTLIFVSTNEASAGSFTYRVTGTGGGLTQWVDITVDISTTVTATLTTDKQSYEKGQQIQISGTAVDPRGNPVESGTANITLRCSSWSDQLSAQIVGGAYAENYYITFDNPEGDWIISVSVVDNRGNLSQSQENTSISVSTPASWRYYTITFLSPVPGTVCSRGSEVTITVQITGSPEKISGADVYLATPSGEIITLTEGSPGIYSTTYVPKWADPLGKWTVSVLGEKTVQGTYKAGTGSTSLDIAPASLELELLEPSQRTFEIGKKVDVKVRVSYPDGSPVDEAIVNADLPNGENLTLLNEGEGIYVGDYSVSSEDLGAWGLIVSAVDAYGNSGASSEVSLSVEELSPSSYPARYWWITIPVILACALAPLPIIVKKLRIKKLKSIKSEIRATEKLRKELPKRYFVKGAIPRETYDSLMHQTMEKLMKLKKETRRLKKKLEKG